MLLSIMLNIDSEFEGARLTKSAIRSILPVTPSISSAKVFQSDSCIHTSGKVPSP